MEWLSQRDRVESGSWRNSALTDGFSSRRELLTWDDWLSGWEERIELEERLTAIGTSVAAKSARRRKRFLLGGATLVLFLLAGLTAMLIRQRREAVASREALRERIAHDLHDELGASLSHLALECDLSRRQLPGDDPVRERLSGIADTARSTLDDMRDVIWLLAPTSDSWTSFQSRIESITERLLTGLDHSVTVDGEPPRGRPPIEWAREWVLFFKEAVTNARRHAGASRIEVRLRWDATALHLAVVDDGRGFDPDEPSLVAGLGLQTYRRRAAALGGAHTIEAGGEQGTVVSLHAPLPRQRTP